QRIKGIGLTGFTVNGFSGEGAFIFCADNWQVRTTTTNDNGEYGIFPSHCGRGRVTRSTATGSNDTGIYVGQSHDVRVDHNLAADTNEVDHNVVTGNGTGGIALVTGCLVASCDPTPPPGYDPKPDADRFEHNTVTGNGLAPDPTYTSLAADLIDVPGASDAGE